MASPSLNEGRGISIASATFSAHLMHRISTACSIEEEGSAIELDSHADSPVVGKHATILRYTGKQVQVSGFTDKLGAGIKVNVVDAALVYDCEYSGKSYLLIIRNALYVKEMKASLIPPFMMRLAGIEINECPKFMARNPTIQHHSIYFPEDDIRIPLQIYGIISYIPVRKPTDEEIDTLPVQVELTPNVPEWQPHNEIYQQQEEAMTNFQGELKEKSATKFIVSSVVSRPLDPVALADDVSSTPATKVYSIKTASGAKSSISPKDLASVWNIGLESAKRTLQVTTRLCPRNVESITLNRRELGSLIETILVSKYMHLSLDGSVLI